MVNTKGFDTCSCTLGKAKSRQVRKVKFSLQQVEKEKEKINNNYFKNGISGKIIKVLVGGGLLDLWGL